MTNELGSLRIIQKQGQRVGSIAMVAGYTSVGLATLAVGVCLCAAYGWHLLKGGRSVMATVRSYARYHPGVTAQATRPTVELEPLTINEGQ